MNSALKILCLVTCSLIAVTARSETPSASTTISDSLSGLVPQNLLRLVHAPEVHQELALNQRQIDSLEKFFFDEVDGDWFRSRILPADQQTKIMSGLEAKLRQWLAKQASDEQVQRLQELEYHSLGIRMLLRPEVAKQLKLEPSQQAQFLKLAQATNDAVNAAQLASQKGDIPESIKSAALAAAQAEKAALSSVLRAEQQQAANKLIGKPFDTAALQRIYPMAPEFVPVEYWLNSKPLQLKELRGKVVLVHFYAFQCHNCHANFTHYNQWHKEFPSDQVVVLGIQTPETSSERDPAAVTAAAKERDFRFPVMIDLQSENWKAWSNTMWPTVYVIDKQGYIRHLWQGELNWQGATHDKTIHDLIEKLVAEEAL